MTTPLDLDAIEARMTSPYGYVDTGEMRDDMTALIAEVKALRLENKRLINERNECDGELEDVTERYNALLNKTRGDDA